MNKKYLIIGLILILIAASGIFYYIHTETVSKVGSSEVSIPNGYSVSKVTETSSIFTNGKNKITVTQLDTSIDKIIKKYKKKHKNDTVLEEEASLKDITIKHLTLKDTDNNTLNNLYLYKKDDKSYQIISKDDNWNVISEII